MIKIIIILSVLIIIITRVLTTQIKDLRFYHILILLLLYKWQKRQKSTYFIKSGNLVKIGNTYNIERRFKQIKANNQNAELLGAIPENIEKYLHKLFKEYRVGGEWFMFAPLKNKINQIIQSYGKNIVK
jgi:hypothetical protein